MEGLTFKFPDDDKDYKVLTFLAPTNGKYQYIVYTDGEEIYASRYSINGKQVVLNDVEEEYEWDYIDQRLAEAQNGK